MGGSSETPSSEPPPVAMATWPVRSIPPIGSRSMLMLYSFAGGDFERNDLDFRPGGRRASTPRGDPPSRRDRWCPERAGPEFGPHCCVVQLLPVQSRPSRSREVATDLLVVDRRTAEARREVAPDRFGVVDIGNEVLLLLLDVLGLE